MSEECNNDKSLEKSLWVLRPELNCLRQDESELSRVLLENYLVPPPPPSRTAKAVVELGNDFGGFSQEGVYQDLFIDEFIFKGRVKDGFFVEAGADDFFQDSNTLFFESLHGWTGLLVEPFVSRFQLG